MKNILVSSTKQWNFGDDFIFYGIKNLLLAHYRKPANFFLWNRNPDVNDNESVTKDNSITYRNDLSFFDTFLFAGTPDWFGIRYTKILPELLKTDIDIMILGIGCGNIKYKFTKYEKDIINRAKFITTRDKPAYDLVKKIYKGPVYNLPCPSIFSANSFKSIKGLNKIGICVQSYTPKNTIHKISKAGYKRIIILIERLKKKYDVELILHYAPEFEKFKQYKDIINFSMNAEDYYAIYNKFDLVISSRLHGGLFAYANGIPSILINQDPRCIGAAENVNYFNYTEPEDITVETVSDRDVEMWSRKIIADINQRKYVYSDILNKHRGKISMNRMSGKRIVITGWMPGGEV